MQRVSKSSVAAGLRDHPGWHGPAAAALAGCGQKGPLTLPAAAAGAGRGLGAVRNDAARRPVPGPRDGAELRLEGHALADLARRFGTPLYVYSRARHAARRSQAYQRALRGRPHLVCYAMKANSSLAVLQTFAQAGCGFDIVSGGELARVLAAGGDAGARRVLRRRQDPRRDAAGAAGRRALLQRRERGRARPPRRGGAWRWAARAPVSLRVNPDVDAGTHPYISTGLKDNKFGIAHDQALAAYRHAASLPGLQVVGIDCHIGSQITQLEPYLDALDRVLDLVEAVEAAGIADPPRRRRRRPGHHLHRRAAAARRRTGGAPAAAPGRARPRPPRGAVRARPLAGRQCRRAADRGAVPQARRDGTGEAARTSASSTRR